MGSGASLNKRHIFFSSKAQWDKLLAELWIIILQNLTQRELIFAKRTCQLFHSQIQNDSILQEMISLPVFKQTNLIILDSDHLCKPLSINFSYPYLRSSVLAPIQFHNKDINVSLKYNGPYAYYTCLSVFNVNEMYQERVAHYFTDGDIHVLRGRDCSKLTCPYDAWKWAPDGNNIIGVDVRMRDTKKKINGFKPVSLPCNEREAEEFKRPGYEPPSKALCVIFYRNHKIVHTPIFFPSFSLKDMAVMFNFYSDSEYIEIVGTEPTFLE